MVYEVHGPPVQKSKGICMYLTSSASIVPFTSEDGRKRKQGGPLHWNHLQGFTLVVIKDGAHSGERRRIPWKKKPFLGGDLFAHYIRRQFPRAFFVLMGASRGAWWAALWAAADERAQVWDRVIMIAGYQRGREGARTGLIVCLPYVLRVCSCSVHLLMYCTRCESSVAL